MLDVKTEMLTFIVTLTYTYIFIYIKIMLFFCLQQPDSDKCLIYFSSDRGNS